VAAGVQATAGRGEVAVELGELPRSEEIRRVRADDRERKRLARAELV
jgi:hypothetical protein